MPAGRGQPAPGRIDRQALPRAVVLPWSTLSKRAAWASIRATEQFDYRQGLRLRESSPPGGSARRSLTPSPSRPTPARRRPTSRIEDERAESRRSPTLSARSSRPRNSIEVLSALSSTRREVIETALRLKRLPRLAYLEGLASKFGLNRERIGPDRGQGARCAAQQPRLAAPARVSLLTAGVFGPTPGSPDSSKYASIMSSSRLSAGRLCSCAMPAHLWLSSTRPRTMPLDHTTGAGGLSGVPRGPCPSPPARERAGAFSSGS